VRDGHVETALDDVERGVGLRVVHDGSFGFAARIDISAETGAVLAGEAVAMSKITSPAVTRTLELAPEPSHGAVTWVSPHEVDPTETSLAEKVEVLSTWTSRLGEKPGVDHVTAAILAVAEDSHLATSGGTVADQRRVRCLARVEALSVDEKTGEFETMRTLVPPAGRGFEHVCSGEIDAELEEMADQLAEKRRAPSVEPGLYDLVIDPSNLWLTIHESIGHATELDRVMGYEAGMAGTSFALFEKLGVLRYGSEVMHVTADRTVEGGLATVAVDDEGVEAQSFELIRDGILVGYQLDRRIAAEQGFARSNGCSYASSPLYFPLQRMANVSLQPALGAGPTTEELIGAVEHGIYVVGDKSWSIDMQRHNFQFTGQRFYKIAKGRLCGQLKDVAYQAQTTEFWGAMQALGGASTWRLGGALNCGKGEPMQTASVSHGCPSALFRQVNILNTRAESGR
ncbi:MAG: TldD/PmbA family protein, partial [Acidimicrobiales bacterium]